MRNQLVSVIIPTYKSRGGLIRSIDSVLSQTYSNIEVIVVDDNNPDTVERRDTETLMSKYAGNNKVFYIQHQANKNGAAARNTGIRNSKGELIAFLDDDDSWLPTKVEKQVAYLSQRQDVDAVYTYTFSGKSRPAVIPYEGNAIVPLLMNRSRMYTSTLLMTRQSLELIGGFDESFRRHQDYELLIKFFRNGFKIGCLQEVLVSYTPLGGNNLKGSDYEKLKDKYLATFMPVLDELESTKKGIKKRIIAANYCVVFYIDLANKNYKNALKVFVKHFKDSPSAFVGQFFYMVNAKRKRQPFSVE